ncbi:MAG: hypothetical protein ABS76_29965 [Pelagibacterium sp. SCN 64-44]|nr:MAG: hypothetical protein ABS76_29965 [Pelagibacterium sp. SCN 64-44]
MNTRLIERIYEAALVPEHWRPLLHEIGAAIGAPAGQIFVFDDVRPVGFAATDLVHEVTRAFCEGDMWRASERIPYIRSRPITGFVLARQYFPPEMMARDDMAHALRAKGLEDQAGAAIALPGGELAVLAFEKPGGERFTTTDLGRLNRHYAHLARAALMAARLGLQEARSRVATLEELGLPACVLTASGQILAGNAGFEAMQNLFTPRAFGRLSLANPLADKVMQQVLLACQAGQEPLVRSIPVAASETHPGTILHVLPLRRTARDLFNSGDILLVASPVSASALVPSPTILNGLFDLTPAESRLAAALAAGQTLGEAGAAQNLRPSTARTYLDRILRKTGTHQQSQLVALLKSAQSFPGRS